MATSKKFLDENGLSTLWDQIENNFISSDNIEIIINAIDTVKADKESPEFTGIPTAPTASPKTNTTQIATTEFVNTAISDAVFAAGGSAKIIITVTPIAGVTATLSNRTTGNTFTGSTDSNGVITKGLVQSLIDKYGKKPKKKKTEYGILNQYVWSKTKGKKIIPNEYFDNIRSGLGLSKTASQNDIIKIMKQAGFSKGGIVETLSKVPGRNGDDGWATLKRGEAILTPEQTKMFQNMVQVMPPFVNAMDTFTNIPSLSQAKITPNQQSISMGDLVLNLPNVTDTESFIKTIKTDTKVQKAIQQTVCDQLSGRGKLNIMKL